MQVYIHERNTQSKLSISFYIMEVLTLSLFVIKCDRCGHISRRINAIYRLHTMRALHSFKKKTDTSYLDNKLFRDNKLSETSNVTLIDNNARYCTSSVCKRQFSEHVFVLSYGAKGLI